MTPPLAAALVVAHCRGRAYPEPVPEYRFHATRRYRFDLAFVDAKVAIELMGGCWVRGRHVRGKGYSEDCAKACLAAAHGWRVLPVVYDQVASGQLFGWLDLIFAGEADR